MKGRQILVMLDAGIGHPRGVSYEVAHGTVKMPLPRRETNRDPREDRDSWMVWNAPWAHCHRRPR